MKPQYLFSSREDPRTWANGVTALRTVAGLAVFASAAYARDPVLNYVGLAIFWVLDVLDGVLARWLRQETRLGAQLDILSDRILASFFYLNYVSLHPAFVAPVALFLFQFNFVDHYLSNQFMRWPLVSPNYFYQVDRRIWALNWSLPAKALNSQFGPLVLIFTGSIWIPSLLSLGIITAKLYSCVLIHLLPLPEAAFVPVVAAEGRTLSAAS